MKGNATRIGTTSKAKYLARCITNQNNIGSASSDKIRAMLNDMRDVVGIRDVAYINEDVIRDYIDHVKDEYANQDISPSTAQARISSLNAVLEYIGRADLRQSGRQHGITRSIDRSDKSNTFDNARAYIIWLQDRIDKGDKDAALIKMSVILQEEFGLRLRESLAIKITDKDPNSDTLRIGKYDQPKNNRERSIDITSERQRDVLRHIQNFIKNEGMRSLIPCDKTLIQHRQLANRLLDKFRQETGRVYHYHGNRHAYAHERYTNLWAARTSVAIVCPATYQGDDWAKYVQQATGLDQQKIKDLAYEIRMTVSSDLGHARIQIT